MHGQGSYHQFCPIAMAAEILCTRWTVLILREMMVGSTRFNELRKGVPRMSPALLSKRLGELEDAGVIRREADPNTGISEYRLTSAGKELWPVIESMGVWGQRWIESDVSLKNLDPDLLMWDMRRNLDPSPMPDSRAVIQFTYTDAPGKRRSYWLVIEPGEEVDLCVKDPGFEVDLFAECDLRTMTMIWMGMTTVRRALDAGDLDLHGDARLARSMQAWLGLSPFAGERKVTA